MAWHSSLVKLAVVLIIAVAIRILLTVHKNATNDINATDQHV